MRMNDDDDNEAAKGNNRNLIFMTFSQSMYFQSVARSCN